METLDINEFSEDSELSSSSNDNSCPDCNEPYTRFTMWCKQCNSKRFQQDFHKWTSGNKFIDKFIQESQLNAKRTYYTLQKLGVFKQHRIDIFKFILTMLF